MIIHVLGRSLHTSEFPIPLPLPLDDPKVTASEARHPFPKNPSVLSLPLSQEGLLLGEILSFWVPAAVQEVAGRGRVGGEAGTPAGHLLRGRPGAPGGA